MKSFIAVQHGKNMIWHKSILIVSLIELCGKISDIHAEQSSKSGNKWGDDMKILNPHQQNFHISRPSGSLITQ